MPHLSTSFFPSKSRAVVTGLATAFPYSLIELPSAKPIPRAGLKEYLNIEVSDTSFDSLLDFIIDAVTKVGEKLTRRDFINKKYRTFRDFLSDDILLKKSRLKSKSDITLFEQTVDGIPVPIDTSLFSVTEEEDYSTIFLLTGKSWPNDTDLDRQSVKIEFKVGFGNSEATVPEDLRTAMLQHAVHVFENRGDCDMSLESIENALPAQSKLAYQLNKIMETAVSSRIG